jgi:DNA-binding transcriptional LysR family regulator
MPQDLTAHTCINISLPTHGGLYPWEFEKDGRELRVRVEGQLIFNSITQTHQAALDGFGVTCLAEELVKADIADGRLLPVLFRLEPVLLGLPRDKCSKQGKPSQANRGPKNLGRSVGCF